MKRRLLRAQARRAYLSPGTSVMTICRPGRIVLWAMGCAALVGTPASTKAEQPSAQFWRLLDSAPDQQAVVAAARRQSKTIFGSCGTVTYAPPAKPVVLRQPQLDGAGKFVDGVWQQRVMAAGCGTQRQLNVLTIARTDRTLRRIALLPGTTIADPLLQRDAIRFATVGAGKLIPAKCDGAAIVDTRFVQFEGSASGSARPGQETKPWREDWTVKGCGQLVVVPVHFIPDATGTTIRTSPEEAHPG